METPKEEKVYDLQDYNNPTYWKFISSPIYYVEKDLMLAFNTIIKNLKWRGTKDHTIRLLDVGCGTGNIMLIAQLLFKHKFEFDKDGKERRIGLYTYGIEHDKRLGELAQTLRIGTVYMQDALTYRDYKDYDIIHYYRPIKETKLMTKLERKIEKEAKVGAVIIARYKADYTIDKNPSFRQLNGDDSKDYSSSDAKVFIKTK